MSVETQPYELLCDIFEKCVYLLNRFEFKSEHIVTWLEKWMEVVEDFKSLMTVILANPVILLKHCLLYLEDLYVLFQTQLKNPISQDSLLPSGKRFLNDAWREQPFFLILSQHYLLLNKHSQLLLDELKVNRHTRFFVQQYLDAASPENFLLTNPQLVSETLESKGRNVLRGLQHFLDDVARNPEHFAMPMTDLNAFQIGHNIAITPGKVIVRNEVMELIQYTPQTPKVKALPLLIIPPWINKYYILDLSPHNSLVRWLVSQGIVVFIISWRNPDKRHAEWGLVDYLKHGPQAAVSAIKAQLQVATVSALGFCIGGTLLSLLLAYNKATNDDSVSSATFLASLIDFSDPGEMSAFMSEPQIAAVEKRMQRQGYLEGSFMASAFNSLRAPDLIWSFFIRHYLQGKPLEPFDLLFWNSDTTNMPAKMHSEYLRWMYLNNDLVKPGKIMMDGMPIDVGAIDVPLFFLSTQKDHIAPWKSTYKGFQLMGGNKHFILGESGHIAGIVSPPNNTKYGYYRHAYYAKNPDHWLSKARYYPGSWWLEWLQWLKRHTGKTVLAPQWSRLPLQPMMDAPGMYVHDKAS